MRKILLYLPVIVIIGTLGLIVFYISLRLFGWKFICLPVWLLTSWIVLYVWFCFFTAGKYQQWSIKVILLITAWIAIGCGIYTHFLTGYRAINFVVSVEVIEQEELIQELIQDVNRKKTPWRNVLSLPDLHEYTPSPPEDSNQDSGKIN